MNSNKRKLQYRFRIHNDNELKAITKYIKRRKFGAMGYDATWVEFNNFDSFLEWVKTQKWCDLMIRVYFNTDYNRDQFRKKINEVLPAWICGNDNCSYEACRYFIYDDLNKGNNRVEYLWRCILADENYSYEED